MKCPCGCGQEFIKTKPWQKYATEKCGNRIRARRRWKRLKRALSIAAKT